MTSAEKPDKRCIDSQINSSPPKTESSQDDSPIPNGNQVKYSINNEIGYKAADDNLPAEKQSFFKFSRQTKIVVVFCAIVNLISSCAFSQIGPFFPQEAEQKGMNLTLTGFVFSVFQLIIFLTSPIFGKYLPKLGAKNVFISGIAIAGIFSIFFGTLHYSPDGWMFITFCILCRSIMALGCSAFKTSSFAIVAVQCPTAIATAFAILEMCIGIGYMVGPVIGGGLYSIGGFGLPFYTTGGLLLLNGTVVYKFLPAVEVTEEKQNGSFFKLLRSPLVLVSMLSLFIANYGITAFEATISTHLDNFDLKVIYISLILAIPPLAHSICGPIWGYITDTKLLHKPLMVFGLLVFCIGWLLTGPSVVLPFIPTEMWIVVMGIPFIGIGYGCIVIPSIKCCTEGALELGYDANLGTYSLVSGLFNSFNSLGGFLGPVSTGALVQTYNHSIGYTVLAGLSVSMSAAGGLFFFFRRKKDIVPKNIQTDLERQNTYNAVEYVTRF